MNEHYKIELNNKTDNTFLVSEAPRGRILDRNLNVIVDNVAVKTITYTKPKNITTESEIDLAYKVSNVINLDYNSIDKLILKQFYILIKKDEASKLITREEENELSIRKLTEDDIYKLKLERITDDILNTLNETDKKAALIYYLMNKGYSYEEKIIKNKASDTEYAFIAENKPNLNGFNIKLSWERIYPYGDTFRSIIGTISTNGLPKEEKTYYLKNGYELSDNVGISGIEKQYESILKGEKTLYKRNDDNTLTVEKQGKKGNDIVLSIDINLQKQVEEMLAEEIIKTKNEANTDFYNKSFIVIENPKTGEIFTLAGKKYIDGGVTDYNYGAINYAVTPGSIVKGASMTVGYKTKVIDIGTILEDRCIKLYNIPEKCSWKTLGMINDLQALEYSSNVYQYKIAMMVGGFDYGYNKTLTIDPKAFDTYRNIFYQYGLGSTTGIDYPNEETGVHGTNTAGDLLINFGIGQYDTYTTIQLSQYMSTLANYGERIKIHLLNKVIDNNGNILYEQKPIVLNKVDIDDIYINRIRQGLNLVTNYGTGVGYMPVSSSAGKTGTSESFVDVDNDGVIDFESISNTFSGFAPFENPIMNVTAVSPDVQNPNRGISKSNVNQRIVKKATSLFFSIYDQFGNKK